MPRQYKSSFLDFMSYKDGKDYRRDHSFTTEELLRIKPDDICRWMNARAYGDPAPDASVAAALAGPSGPCFYVLKSDLPCITTQLLVNDIAPTVKHVMGESTARTLALPLLWAALQPRHAFEQELLPDRLRERIVGAYVGAGGNAEINPVEREAFRVSGDGAELNLVVLRDEASQSTAPDPAAALSESDDGGGSLRRELAALQSQIFSLHRSMMEYMKELMREVLRSRHECHCDSLRNLAILRRVATPAVARQVVREDQREDTGSEDTTRTPSSQHALVARLSKRPKTCTRYGTNTSLVKRDSSRPRTSLRPSMELRGTHIAGVKSFGMS